MNIRQYMIDSDNELFFDKPIIEEYERVFQKKQKKFTLGTWTSPDARDNATLILRYVIEIKLNLSFEELGNLRLSELCNTHHLNGLVKHGFKKSFQESLLDIYGNYLKPWHFHLSTRYLSDDGRVESWFQDFASTYLNFNTKEELLAFFSTTTLRKHGKIFSYFEGSPYRIYRFFYERGDITLEIEPYEFAMGYARLWEDKEVVDSFLRYLLKDYNITTAEDFTRLVSTKDFRTKMKGLYVYFHSSPWEVYQYLEQNKLIDFRLSIFDLKIIPNGFYKKEENIAKALRWLIYFKLKITSREEFLQKFSVKEIEKHIRGLGVYLTSNEMVHEFLRSYKIIPWSFYPWEFKKRPSTLWESEETRQQAIVWFFDIFLGLESADVSPDSFKVVDIWDARLKEMYQPYYSKVYENPKETWVKHYHEAKRKVTI